MKKSLMDVIFASEKRKAVLLMLMNGEKEISVILNSLKTSRNSLLPQIRTLEEHHLVCHHKDSYKLTTIGKIVVGKMVPLLDKTEFLDVDIDHWGTHDIDFLSPELLEGIGKLAQCKVVSPPLSGIYNPPEEMYAHYSGPHEITDVSARDPETSDFFLVVTRTLYMNFDEIISSMLERKMKIRIIVSTSLFEKIQNGEYSYFAEFLKNKLFRFYVYPEKIDFLSFGCTSDYLILRLLTNDGGYDNRYMLCSDLEAIEWGNGFFEHYLEDSIPITELYQKNKKPAEMTLNEKITT
ncbi:winged helix-turn-helix domain-containing protein [Methanolobus sp. WCC4]|uniref:helix-turn-helix transcriptional regulator n=1 Tax=Methanolobus sp. WCC4 TaxID=3125784 RepID=UPI0030FAEF3A